MQILISLQTMKYTSLLVFAKGIVHYLFIFSLKLRLESVWLVEYNKQAVDIINP